MIPVPIPPLRERIEDILPLTRHLLEKNCRAKQRPLMNLEKDALEGDGDSYQINFNGKRSG